MRIDQESTKGQECNKNTEKGKLYIIKMLKG